MGTMYQLTIDEKGVVMDILKVAEDPQDDPVVVGSIRMTKEKARKLESLVSILLIFPDREKYIAVIGKEVSIWAIRTRISILTVWILGIVLQSIMAAVES